MSAEFLMDEASEKYGWSLRTQLYLALEYISNQKDDNGFREFIQYAIDVNEEGES